MADSATQGNKKATTRTTTSYVILEQVDNQGEPSVSYLPVGKFEGIGADAAINQAAKILAGDGRTEFTLVAVPARSWQPQTFKLEVPAPRLVRA